MNIEEAEENFGKEVIFDNSIFENCNRPQIKSLKLACRILIFNTRNSFVCINLFDDQDEMIDSFFVEPEYLKLKEQPMQNYKIKVTPETSAEVQKLFFELGYGSGRKIICQNPIKCIFATSDGKLWRSNQLDVVEFSEKSGEEITLPQLRDLVILKRNDVGDATHKDDNNYLYYEDSQWDKYKFYENNWSKLFPHEYRNTFYCLKKNVKEQPQITWKDAEKAIKEGKDVQVFVCEWDDIGDVFKNHKFRIKPQTIHIEGGEYTKEEYLNILKKFD